VETTDLPSASNAIDSYSPLFICQGEGVGTRMASAVPVTLTGGGHTKTQRRRTDVFPAGLIQTARLAGIARVRGSNARRSSSSALAEDTTLKRAKAAEVLQEDVCTSSQPASRMRQRVNEVTLVRSRCAPTLSRQHRESSALR
jgi:hypothetical protein